MEQSEKFGCGNWYESDVDAKLAHFELIFVSDVGAPILAAKVGYWCSASQYFPCQLFTSDPEAIANAVDVVNKAFNKMLSFDVKAAPERAWLHFKGEAVGKQPYFIDRVYWKFVPAEALEFDKALNQFIEDCEAPITQSNWQHVILLPAKLAHFTLYFKQLTPHGEPTYLAAAKVGEWDIKSSAFPVQLLVDDSDILERVIENLNYYLKALPAKRGERADCDFAQIWQYQCYHSASAATHYDTILWRFTAEKNIVATGETHSINSC